MMTMELCVNNNNQGEGVQSSTGWSNSCRSASTGKVRPKRDFRFQVIQVRQGPKWFIWPSKKNRSNEDLSNVENNNVNNNNASNNAGTVNNSIRRPFSRSAKHTLNLNSELPEQVAIPQIDGEMTPVTATSQPFNCPTSEPTTRRLSTIHKAKTEPISSTAVPSSTFKILSISKKWESGTDDELDDLENCMVVSCRQMSLNLDQPQSTSYSSSPPDNANQVR